MTERRPVASAEARAGHAPTTVRLCDLVRYPRRHDGAFVRLRARAVLGPESFELQDAGCPSDGTLVGRVALEPHDDMADVLSVSDGYTIRKWREALEAGRTVPDPRATWHPPEEPAAPVDPRRWSRTVEWLEHRGGSGIVVASGRFDYYKPARLLRYRGGKFTFVPDGVIAPYHGDSRRIVVEAIDPDEGAR